MKHHTKLAFTIASAGFLAFASKADAVEVPFVGTVVSTCALVVVAPGVLGLNTDGDVLSSKETGGSAGLVEAIATSPAFDLSVSSPAAFRLIPVGATADATFVSTYSTTGATTTPETNEATDTSLNTGITNINVDLEATKTSGVYSAGIYEADVTVTCE